MLAATSDLLDNAVGFGVLVGGIGYAAGQFMSARRRGVSDALETALDEVAAMKLRADRFEAELHRQASDMAELRAENVTLRSVVSGGKPVIEALDRTKREVEEYATAEHEKTRAFIERVIAEGDGR